MEFVLREIEIRGLNVSRERARKLVNEYKRLRREIGTSFARDTIREQLDAAELRSIAALLCGAA
jgi:hypothetical protein